MESENTRAVFQLWCDVRTLETKISEPSHADVLTLIRVYETISRINMVVEDEDATMKKHLLEEIKKIARLLVISYLPLEEMRLERQAENAIRENNEFGFRQAIRGIEELNNDVGKIAYDYGWLKWNERPWHVYDTSKTLKEKFVTVTGCEYHKLLDWDKEDEYRTHMDWE